MPNNGDEVDKAAILRLPGGFVPQGRPATYLCRSAALEDAMVHVRAFHPDDAPGLLALFRDTIRRVNSRDYSAQQIRAWASDEIDAAEWSARFAGRFVAVAEFGRRVVGFAVLEEGGHVDRFYVSADYQRHGVGRALLEALVAEARQVGVRRLFTEASITARPFFESQGFAVMAPQVVVVRGIEFTNYQMERQLA